MLEYGAKFDNSRSHIEALMIINDAEILYRNHIEELKKSNEI